LIEKTISLADTVITALTKKRMTISTAESCTGGLIGAYLTEISGASAVYFGGIIAYDNSIKERILGVPEEILKSHGAVSAPTVEYMAASVCRNYQTNIGISVSGVAGPGGGTPEKPVGLVYIGVAQENSQASYRHLFSGSRREVREKTVVHALNYVLELLQST